jgi:hypothetical protein
VPGGNHSQYSSRERSYKTCLKILIVACGTNAFFIGPE